MRDESKNERAQGEESEARGSKKIALKRTVVRTLSASTGLKAGERYTGPIPWGQVF